ncbi:MAG: hypothetical protein KAS12_00005 [Candidatus Aenigmarchaeota archaeon]|nr:hypothetical protein [Candidatus Aenigmarchaeota archaeon]
MNNKGYEINPKSAIKNLERAQKVYELISTTCPREAKALKQINGDVTEAIDYLKKDDTELAYHTLNTAIGSFLLS